MTIGGNAVDWSLRQERYHNPPPAALQLEVFSRAMRDGKLLGLTGGNGCAVFASAAAFDNCAPFCALVPHGYRAAAKELRDDAIRNDAWVPIADVRAGLWIPRRGDLAIYDRAVANDPATSWYGHVDRVVKADRVGYFAIGANEGANNAWDLDYTEYSYPQLLGFIAYPQVPSWQVYLGVGTALAAIVLSAEAVGRGSPQR